MTKDQKEFIKNIQDYLGYRMTEFDENKIISYLEEYVGKLPQPKPITIVKEHIVYKGILIPSIKDKKLIAPFEVMDIVCNVSGVSADEICSKSREKNIVKARHTLCYFIKINCDITLYEIAKIINKKDHTSIIHAITKVKDMIESGDRNYTKLFELVDKRVSEIKSQKIAA